MSRRLQVTAYYSALYFASAVLLWSAYDWIAYQGFLRSVVLWGW